MRYIRKYDGIVNDYQVGDYVLINLSKDFDDYESVFGDDYKDKSNIYAYIFNIDPIQCPAYPYYVRPATLDEDDNDKMTSVKLDEIVRKLNSEELKNLEVEKNMKKYNL